MSTSSRTSPSPERLAERALRRPSSTIWLNHVGVATRQFDEAIGFYVGTLGLALRTVEVDPAHPTRLRARLTDAEDRDVLELVEADTDAPGPNVSQLAFSLPRRAWQLLRARLDTQDVPYELLGDCLFLIDLDGIHLRVSPLDDA